MTEKKATRWQIYTGANPTVERIIPELAVEIGLNESIVLMQISFWISQSTNVRDGVYWTYNSIRTMHKEYFPYWSIETIRRTIKNLETEGYILIGNFNKRKGDNTQWFALEPDKLSTLQSVLVAPALGVKTEGKLSQNETPLSQNETTLPETSTDIKKTSPPKVGGTKSKPDPKPATPRPPHKNAPWHDALLECFGLTPETVTSTGDKTYWVAAADLARINFPVEKINDLHEWCVDQDWPNFTVMALAKHAGEWLADEDGDGDDPYANVFANLT